MDLSLSGDPACRSARKALRSGLLLSWLLIAWLAPSDLEAQVPHGVFALFGTGTESASDALQNPDVVGISIRQDWAELEPSEGSFDWSFLDGEVAKAAANGKVILMRINTQARKPAWVTNAIEQAGGFFFTFDDDGVPTTIPVFWDPTFLAKKKAMITALGAHFTSNPTVKIVVASFANAKSEDWSVPHTGPDVANWLAVGYTTEKMLDAGKQIIDTTMAAFPNQYVTLAVGGNGHVGGTNLDPSATYVAASAVAAGRAAWPGRLIVQINSLSTFNPVAPGTINSTWNLLWNSQPDVAAQMVYWCYDEPTYRVNGGVPGDPATILTASINAGVSYGTNYIEIYEKDVRNLPSIITYARSVLAPGTAASSLLNVSTRLPVGLTDHVAISGFIVGGTGPKKVLLRAIGPSLSEAGLTGLLADPYLELHDQSGAIIATNDNWETTQLGGIITADQEAAIRASGIPPNDSAEAVLIADLNPGAYTAVVRGADNGTGLGLAEIFDLSQGAPAAISNLSTRGEVQTEADVMIGGFIVGGSETSTVVVRALGPSLAAAGVTGVLMDPTLDLRDGNGALVSANDNWADTQQTELEDSGLAPSDAREAAIKQTLPPGGYTATVTGLNGGVGVGLVEIYRLP
jgi:hypothetical protein